MYPINESVRLAMRDLGLITEETRKITYSSEPTDEEYDGAAELVNGGGQMVIRVSGDYIQDNAVATVVATDGETVVGTASIKKTDSYPDMAEIGYTAVNPKYQRQGIAQRLTKLREQKAAELGIGLLFATVREQQRSSRGNLEKAGFTHVGTQKSRYSSNMLVYYSKGIGMSDEEAADQVRDRFDIVDEGEYTTESEEYSVELSKRQKRAKEAGTNPNQLENYVPYARKGGVNTPLVAKIPNPPPLAGKTDEDGQKHERYYGYQNVEQAQRRIEQAKTQPGWADTDSFFIAVMIGDRVVDLLHEDGTEWEQ